MFKPNEKLPGKFSINDGTLDFYLRVRTIINKKKIVLDLGVPVVVILVAEVHVV